MIPVGTEKNVGAAELLSVLLKIDAGKRYPKVNEVNVTHYITEIGGISVARTLNPVLTSESGEFLPENHIRFNGKEYHTAWDYGSQELLCVETEKYVRSVLGARRVTGYDGKLSLPGVKEVYDEVRENIDAWYSKVTIETYMRAYSFEYLTQSQILSALDPDRITLMLKGVNIDGQGFNPKASLFRHVNGVMFILDLNKAGTDLSKFCSVKTEVHTQIISRPVGEVLSVELTKEKDNGSIWALF